VVSLEKKNMTAKMKGLEHQFDQVRYNKYSFIYRFDLVDFEIQ